MISRYNRYHRDAGQGYRLCHRDDFWTPVLCDAVINAVTGIFQNSSVDIPQGQTVQQTGWITAGATRYYMICNIVKETGSDTMSGTRNIYTADFLLISLTAAEQTLFFFDYENVFLAFTELYRMGRSYQRQGNPRVFRPMEGRLQPPREQPAPGLMRKFVSDPDFNNRIIDVVSWWSAAKDRILALNFDGLNGVLETARNLYHMLPLYARTRFGFTSYTPDPSEKLRRAPGCSVLCTQQKDRERINPGPLPPDSGVVDFFARRCAPPTAEDRYYTHAFQKLIKTDSMNLFNAFLLQNWRVPEIRALAASDDLRSKEALIMLFAAKQSISYLQPDLGDRQRVAQYLRSLDSSAHPVER